MILIKILISYYKDKKEIEEKDVDVELKSKRQIMSLCLWVYGFQSISVYSCSLLYYLIWTVSCNMKGVEK